MSIKYLTPFGGENLDSLYGDFTLKFAKGGEQWIPIGDHESKPAIKEELVWGDDYDLSTRALNWRQCDRTKMTGSTANGYFIMDGFSDVNRENIEKAAEEFINVATKLFGGESKIYWLDCDHPQAEVSYTSKPLGKKEVVAKNKGSTERKITKKTNKNASGKPFILTEEDRTSIGYILKQIIFQAVKEIVGDKLQLKREDIKVEHPINENYGDYSTNLALILAGRLGMKPFDIAERMKNKLSEYIRTHQTISDSPDSKHPLKEKIVVSDILENVTIAHPGFVNLTIQTDYLITLIAQLLKSRDGVISTYLKGKRIAV